MIPKTLLFSCYSIYGPGNAAIPCITDWNAGGPSHEHKTQTLLTALLNVPNTFIFILLLGLHNHLVVTNISSTQS